MPSLLEIDPVALEKKKMWKVYDDDNYDDNNDGDGQRTKLTWAFGSGELNNRQRQILRLVNNNQVT